MSLVVFLKALSLDPDCLSSTSTTCRWTCSQKSRCLQMTLKYSGTWRTQLIRKKMQADLDSLQKWSEIWLLRFNASKCKRMHMGGTNQCTNYNLWGEVIPHDTEEKDLGVIITEDGKISRQCAAAATKAMIKLRIIKRTFKQYDIKCFTMLFRTYIRPHLEYAVQAWSPHLKKDIAMLGKVQLRATKLLPRIRHMSYPERLQALKLYNLEQRIVRGDMIETFKILKVLDREIKALQNQSTLN